MKKGTILGDTFEQLAELGQSTAKKTVKSMAQIVNPFDGAKTSAVSGEPNTGKTAEVINRGKDHTPLDFKKLNDKFQDKDKLQAEALRSRYFQSVKREDEKILERKNMSEQQKKQQEANEAYEQKRREQQKKQTQQQDDMPTGKAKRGIMARKKSSEQQHVENKPASGKQ
ncbi:MAG: hypothetical protein NUV58_04085 [Candidatus Roizmanbacteria bacterium]|nr:hypothetical protein [Candidatus Roizmanbacteria bacterium]